MSDHVPPTPVEPPGDHWLTAAAIVQWRPFLNERTLRTWHEHKWLPTTRRGTGRTAPVLYRLRDVDDLLNASVTPAQAGPLAGRS